MRPLLLSFVVALAGCSFTTGSNFTECTADVDCGSAAACMKHYCLPLPPGCRRSEPGGTKNPFTVPGRVPLVAILPVTTDNGETDDSELQSINAMNLAISQANERLADHLFGLFVCDTGAKVDGGGLDVQASWFVANLHAPVFIVSSSSPTNALAQNAARLDAGSLIISPNATSSELRVRHATLGNVWRVAPPDTGQAKVLADLIKQAFPDGGTSPDGGMDAGVAARAKIAIIHTTSIYGTGFANPLNQELSSRGFDTEQIPFDSNDTTQRSAAVRRAASVTPTATVVIGNSSHLVEFVTTARTSLPELTRDAGHRWFLTDGLKDPSILTDVTRPELTAALGTAPAQGAGAAYSIFRTSFTNKYGLDPDTTNYTSHSYDTAWLVMLATQYALANTPDGGELSGARIGEGMTRFATSSGPAIPFTAEKWTELADALSRGTTTNVEGTSGPLDFDADAGVPQAPYEIWQVADGGIRVVRQVWP